MRGHSQLSAIARQRSLYTGEPHRLAVQELRQRHHESPIPEPSTQQAALEQSFLTAIGRSGTVANGGWLPGDPVFGLNWISPSRHRLIVKVDLRFLPDIAQALLPCQVDPYGEIYGITGLRWRPDRTGITLYRIGTVGHIHLYKLTASVWQSAIKEAAVWGDFRTNLIEQWPNSLSPAENAFLKRYPKYHDDESDQDAISYNFLAAGILRRILLFGRDPKMGSIDLWHNCGSMREELHIEWFDGQHHQPLIDALLDPHYGIKAALDRDFFCKCHATQSPELCYEAVVTSVNSGALLHLRRNSDMGYRRPSLRGPQKLSLRRQNWLNQIQSQLIRMAGKEHIGN